jgi:hypothetical protein
MFARITPPGRLLAAGLLALLALAATTGPAPAAGPAFTATSSGTWSLTAAGDAVVRGPGELVIGRVRAQPAPVTAEISAFDSTLPPPGACEDAFGSIALEGTRTSHARLAGTGVVCGVHVQTPSIVTHVFTGTFEVDEGHQPLYGATGFMEIRLAQDRSASTFAVTY